MVCAGMRDERDVIQSRNSKLESAHLGLPNTSPSLVLDPSFTPEPLPSRTESLSLVGSNPYLALASVMLRLCPVLQSVVCVPLNP